VPVPSRRWEADLPVEVPMDAYCVFAIAGLIVAAILFLLAKAVW
jgi:hypothetical protein